MIVVVQVIFCGVYAAWVTLHIVVWWGPVLFLGCFLFQLKSICVKRVWNVWVSLFTLTYPKLKHHCANMKNWWNGEKSIDPDGELYIHWKSCEVADTDAGMFNESVLVEFFFESIPQLVLQGINNSFAGEWRSPIVKISFIFSAFMVVNGVWSFGYPVLFNGVTINDVPVRLSIFGFTIQIRTEALDSSRTDADVARQRKTLALTAWNQIISEVARVTAMSDSRPAFAETADALVEAIAVNSIVKSSSLTPDNVSLLLTDFDDNPVLKLSGLRGLRAFDIAREAELREEQRLQAIQDLKIQNAAAAAAAAASVRNPMIESQTEMANFKPTTATATTTATTTAATHVHDPMVGSRASGRSQSVTDSSDP